MNKIVLFIMVSVVIISLEKLIFSSASTGYTNLHYAASDGSLVNVKKSLSQGLDINSQTPCGKSALYLAINNRRFDVVEFLLSRQAVWLYKDKFFSQQGFRYFSEQVTDLKKYPGIQLLCNYHKLWNDRSSYEVLDDSLSRNFQSAWQRYITTGCKLGLYRIMCEDGYPADRRLQLQRAMKQKLYEELLQQLKVC